MKRKRRRSREQVPISRDQTNISSDYVSHTYVQKHQRAMADENSPTPEESAENALLRHDIKHWVRFLEPASRQIVYLYFGLVSGYQMSVEQVALETYRTPEAVQTMLEDALLKLRTFAELDGWAHC